MNTIQQSKIHILGVIAGLKYIFMTLNSTNFSILFKKEL